MDTRKTVLVTGCNPGGIGNSLAREFNSHGLRVLATARQTSSISDLAEIGIETFALEVTDAESITKLKQEIISRTGGKLDYLVNNAGRNYTVAALDMDFEEVKLTFEVNVVAVMRMCKAFAPLLIEAKGTIVQIGSLAGLMPYVSCDPNSYSNNAKVFSGLWQCLQCFQSRLAFLLGHASRGTCSIRRQSRSRCYGWGEEQDCQDLSHIAKGLSLPSH